MRKMRREQWYSEDEYEQIRKKKLGILLQEITTHVPYYRDRFGNGRKELNLSDFPLMDKAEIRAHEAELLHDNIANMGAQKNSTSGSTGQSLFFRVSAQALAQRSAAHYNSLSWLDCCPCDSQAVLWGNRFDEEAESSLIGRLRKVLMPLQFFSSYELREDQLAEFAERLKANKVRLLTSYPSPLEYFAKYIQRKGLKFPKLHGIISASEQLFPHQRQLFEEVFGCPVFNRYGSREFGLIATECEQHDGLHIQGTRFLIEILTEDGHPCAPGEVGDLYITDLDNWAMPFVRYRIGDLASWSGKPCKCGRILPVLSGLHGRSFDLVRDSAGNVVSGTFWTLLTRYVSEQILAFQVQQNVENAIELRLVMADGKKLTHEEESLLRKKVAEKLPALTVTLTYVPEIPLTASGKKRFVISSLVPHPDSEK